MLTKPAARLRAAAAQPAEQPLYRRVTEALQAEIADGTLPVGARLPTEHALCRRFGVSRHTVRGALQELREAGLVTSRQGSGSTVAAARPAFSVPAVASVPDLMQYAIATRYVVARSGFVTADAKLARQLGCSPGRRWLRAEGLRYAAADAPPFCWTEVYVHADYDGVRRLIGRRSGPIYRWIEELYGVHIAEVVQTLRAATVPAALAAGLAVAPGSAALEIERVYKTARHKIIEVAFNLHPADRFSYSIALRPERG